MFRIFFNRSAAFRISSDKNSAGVGCGSFLDCAFDISMIAFNNSMGKDLVVIANGPGDSFPSSRKRLPKATCPFLHVKHLSNAATASNVAAET